MCFKKMSLKVLCKTDLMYETLCESNPYFQEATRGDKG